MRPFWLLKLVNRFRLVDVVVEWFVWAANVVDDANELVVENNGFGARVTGGGEFHAFNQTSVEIELISFNELIKLFVWLLLLWFVDVVIWFDVLFKFNNKSLLLLLLLFERWLLLLL